jgi:prevent-host-death family protein
MKTATIVEESTTDLAQVLDAVENGETVTILRAGKPVANVLPASSHRNLTPEEIERAVEELRELRKGVNLNGLSIREMIEEGRA